MGFGGGLCQPKGIADAIGDIDDPVTLVMMSQDHETRATLFFDLKNALSDRVAHAPRYRPKGPGDSR